MRFVRKKITNALKYDRIYTKFEVCRQKQFVTLIKYISLLPDKLRGKS